MIFRLLLLFLIVWFILWMFKKQFSTKDNVDDNQQPRDSEDIIPCHYCGIHAPKSTGLMRDGEFYCCEEHAQLDETEK